jgi:hypothetical protein
MATIHHLLKQLPHRPDLPRQLLEFRQLSARQFLPALRRRSSISKTKEKFPDLIQRKPRLPRPLDYRQSVKYGRVVASLSAHSLSRKKDSNLFVVPNRRRLKSNLSRHLGNGHLRHVCILDHTRLDVANGCFEGVIPKPALSPSGRGIWREVFQADYRSFPRIDK